jgi:hypothetical protein
MPIYEYQGQQYEIETDDQAAAKAKILTYLGQPTPAAPVAPVASAAGAPNVFAAKAPPAPPAPEAKAEPKPYTSRDEALDDAVNLLEEGVDKDEIRPAFEKMGLKWDEITAHGKKRGSDYFKPQTTTTTKPTEQIGATAEPSGRLSAAPEKGYGEQFANVFKRAKSNYEDISTAYLTQAGVINPSDAGRLISQTAKRRYNAAPTQETQDGMQEIGSAETFGDAISAMVKNPGATLSMLTDSLMLSLPAMAPAMVLGPAGAVVSGVAGGSSSFGLEYGSAMSDVLQSKGVDLLNAEAVANALSNPKIMAQIKEQGLKRGIPIGVIDGLTMGLAGRFLKPAHALIAEGKLTGTAARKATIAAWSKELGMQMSGGAGGEKIAQVAAGQDKPADVVMEALAEGVHAPFEAMSNLRGSAALERQAALGNLPTTVPGERVDPYIPRTATAPAEVPSERIEPTLEAQDASIPPTTPTEEPPASPSGVVPESTGASVPVVSEPGAVAPAEGVAGVEPSGVVPSTEDAGGVAAGKGNVPASVAPDLASVAALPDTKTVFRTKRGSTYAFHNDGTTTRNRSGEGHEDTSTGVQPRSGKTIFVTPENANRIGGWVQNRDAATQLLPAIDAQGEPTGKANVVLTEDYGPKKAGTVVATVPYSKQPRVGMQPIEIYQSESPIGDTGRGMHFGTTITEVASAAKVLKETPSGTETPEAQQTEAQRQAAAAVPTAAEEVAATAEQLPPTEQAAPQEVVATAEQLPPAEQAAPQEVSVNENEVRASAVPLPNGRVEPYLSRNTEPLTAEEAATEEADEGISVFEKLRKSKLGEEQPAIADALLARDPRTALTVLRSLVDRNWSNMAYGAIEKLVSQPTFTFLADWSGIKALEDASIQLQQMHGFSQSLLADTYAIYKPLQKLLNPLFSNPKKFREKFTDLVYGSTLLRYDPADPTATPMEGRSKKALDDARKLDQMYKTLGEKGQQMYKDLRGHYEKMIKLYSDLLDAQIMQLPGMASEAKENLINVLRKTFEADARIRPFFPLVRRGDFWLRVEEMKGADLHTQFYMFESVGDREAARTTMLNDNPNAKMSSGEGISQLRIKTYKTSEMLTKIFDAIDKENFGAEQADGTAKEALKDAIYQVYLNTMPEQSFRNQFIHRKDITGFSTDLLRNIATTASRTSMQLARLKYSPLLRNSLSAARDAVEGRPNMSPFVIEAEKRVNLALSGEGGGVGEAISGVANKASFFWFLSGASSALIQPASVYIAGLPVLAGNHNNAKGAAYELARVSKLIGQFGIIKKNKDGTTSYTAPSIANNKSLTDLERDAVNQMVDRGVSQSTYASLVYGHRDTNISSSTTVLGKVGHIGATGAKLLTSSLMHNIERMTREGVYLAAYRLGIKSGMEHDAAINQAVKDVNEALGNYDVTNRPRWTQQGVGKMAFQFKMFPLHNTLMLLTNFTKMLPLLNEEGKKAAAVKFFGTFMTVGSIAGVAGLPFFATSLSAVALAFRSLQKKDDWPKELKDMDINTWFRNVFLPDHLGEVSIGGVPLSELVDTGPINALTQSAISERIGLSDMWGRDMKEMKTAREGISQFALEMAGPSVGLALSFADAYDAYMVGDIQKMQERLSPAALRNILAMLRIKDEGILDVAGNDVVAPEDVSTYRLVNQAIGFRAATQAKASDVPSKLKGVTQQIANRRMLIQNRIKFQARKGTKEGMDKVGDIVDNEVLKFNDDFPRQKILFGEIRTMIDDDRKARLKSRVGMNPDLVKKNIELVDDALYHLENRISREEKARRASKEK